MIIPPKISKSTSLNIVGEKKTNYIFRKIKSLAKNVIYIKHSKSKQKNILFEKNSQKEKLSFFKPLVRDELSDNQFNLRLIDHNSKLLKSAQTLRYISFFDGKKICKKKIDIDIYDKFSEHLVVTDKLKSKNKVIGTYRLLTKDMMPSNFDFYTSSEFDISKLKKFTSNILEVGRSCVDKSYRNGRIIKLLWRGLAREIVVRNIEIVIGCASFPTTDQNQIVEELSYLKHYHSPPKDFDTLPVDSKALQFQILSKKKLNSKRIFKRLPPLIKAYIRTGAWFGSGAVVDKEFKTIDVCVVLKTLNIRNKYLELGN